MPIGSILSVAGPIIGGLLSSNAASDAASVQANAANNASANTMAMFNTQQGNLAPWRTAGYTGLNAMLYALGLPGAGAPSGGGAPPNPSQFMTGTPGSPGAGLDLGQYESTGAGPILFNGGGGAPTFNSTAYNNAMQSYLMNSGAPPSGGYGFGFGALNATPTMANIAPFLNPSLDFIQQQGQSALLNNASALGGVNSGNTMRALQDYGQNTALSLGWSPAVANFNNWQNNLFSRLNTLSGTGANAAGNIAGLGMNAVGAAGDYGVGAANANAAGIVGSSNAMAGGFNSAANNYLLYNALQNNQTPPVIQDMVPGQFSLGNPQYG